MQKPDSTTIPFLLWVLVLFPALGVHAWLRLRRGKPFPPKPRRYQGMIALQLLLFALTILPARQNSVSLFRLVAIPVWIWFPSAAYLALIAVRIATAWPRLSDHRKQRARLILPENPAELRYWVPISILAGVCEEFAYRGVAYAALTEITGSPLLSLGICVAAFATAHFIQGWRGVLGAGVLALLFHLMVFLTQTLCLAIVFHAAYDLIVGFLGMRALMRDALQGTPEAQVVS